jgi:SAM-dependent methyltransferase
MTDFSPSADQFVARYAPSLPWDRGPSARPPLVPTLADSLDFFGRLADMPATLDSLGTDCRCLLQGCTAPGNAAALRRFLGAPGGRAVRVSAVDLLDLPGIYARLGWPMPDMDFVRADARDLAALFPPGRFDLVIQDFLLNCAPPHEAPALLRAARHVLNPGGLLLLSVTDSAGLPDYPAIAPADFASFCGVPWDPMSRDLEALLPDERQRADVLRTLVGRVVMGPTGEDGTLITAPNGRFEFFVPMARTMTQLRDAGFDVVRRGREHGRDDNGLDCTRWRCLARVI